MHPNRRGCRTGGTNGGYGGVQYALRYGVPIVTSSGQEDKPEVAGRVAWSGVGRRINSETPSPTAVRQAVRAVLDDPGYRDRAQQVSRSVARATGLTGLTHVVDHLAATRLHSPPSRRTGPAPGTQRAPINRQLRLHEPD